MLKQQMLETQGVTNRCSNDRATTGLHVETAATTVVATAVTTGTGVPRNKILEKSNNNTINIR
jgi:hypothetical protein